MNLAKPRFSLPRRWRNLSILAFAALLAYFGGKRLLIRAFTTEIAPVEKTDELTSKISYVRPLWQVDRFTTMPGEIHSLLTSEHKGQVEVYCGAGSNGEVFRFNAEFPGSVRRLHPGFGKDVENGISVNTHLAIHKLGESKKPHLIATIDQVVPVGRPWLYMMDVSRPDCFLGVIQPDIASSWGHGIGYFRDEEGKDAFITTYCGHGEVVEFQYRKTEDSDGFVNDGIACREIGKLPGSGEYLQTVDLDGDGIDEMIVVSGYRPKQAHLRIYRQLAKSELERVKKLFGPDYVLGDRWCLVNTIHEDNKFGNVRFIAGKATADGRPQIIAWWCADLLGGECNIIRYAFSRAEKMQRQLLVTGDSFYLWPVDGQMALADTNNDSVPEVWFSSSPGDLWRMVLRTIPFESQSGGEGNRSIVDDSAPLRNIQLSPGVHRFDLICECHNGFGPITPLTDVSGKTGILISSGRHILKVKAPENVDANPSRNNEPLSVITRTEAKLKS